MWDHQNKFGPFANSTLFFCLWLVGFCIIKGIKKANANILWFITFQLLNLMIFGAVLGNRNVSLVFPLLLQLKAIETGIILLIVYIKICVFRKSPWSNSSCTMQHIKFVERFSKLIKQNISHTCVKIRHLCLFHKSYS